jgi:hypothetical protein
VFVASVAFVWAIVWLLRFRPVRHASRWEKAFLLAFCCVAIGLTWPVSYWALESGAILAQAKAQHARIVYAIENPSRYWVEFFVSYIIGLFFFAGGIYVLFPRESRD